MENLRRFVRYRCEHPLWVRPYKKPDGEYQLVEVQNISAGGAYFISSHRLKVNQVLELAMELPNQFSMLSLRGPVRHIQKQGDLFYCGLAFDQVPKMRPHDFSHTIECFFAKADKQIADGPTPKRARSSAEAVSQTA